ncbi:MAG: hypothetical protein A2Z16_16480 [Chloroflexi bacterium RBG_16_54_18]|nr:MAG: hypothetical protein A2Z16_16480 [Chloroflexi bacterium RBG_16_54_18]
MKPNLRIAVFLILMAVLALPSSTALAKGFVDDKIVAGGTYTLKGGEVLDGDLVILGGVVTLEEGSTVTGNVTLLGGTLSIKGTVERDVVGLGGVVSLDSQAVIRGDLTAVAAALNRAEGSLVIGQVITGFEGPLKLPNPGWRDLPQPSRIEVANSQFWNGLWYLFGAFLWSALAVLVVMFLPNPSNRISQAVFHQPVLAGSIGLLTAIVAPILLILLMVTILLIPVSLLGVLALVAAWVLGRIAIGLEVGRRMGEMSNRDWPAAVAAGIGTFVLSLVVDGISLLIPCIGWLAPALIGVIGVGGVLLTRFGAQPYPPSNGGASLVVPGPVAPPPPSGFASPSGAPGEDAAANPELPAEAGNQELTG